MVPIITMPRLMAVGGGALAELPGILQRLGLTRPLVVTDPFLVRSGHLERATAILDEAGIPWRVFSDTVADPTTAVVEAGTRRLAEGSYDSLVAIGGGSSIDTAKAMSVLAANGGQMRDYKVPAEIPKAGLPVVAIPTTAGTGSEVTRFTVITDTETDEKMLIAGLACCPIAAIVDYELTLTMPLRLTADTGLDSLTHAIEAYVSRRANSFYRRAGQECDGADRRPHPHRLRRARQPGRARGDDARRDDGGDGVLECQRRSGPRHEPADRRLLPRAARAVERDAAARDHRLFGAGRARALRRLRPRDGNCRRGRGEPSRGRPPARRIAPAQRGSEGADPARLGHRCRALRRAVAGDGEPGARLGFAGQQPAGAASDEIIDLYRRVYG